MKRSGKAALLREAERDDEIGRFRSQEHAAACAHVRLINAFGGILRALLKTHPLLACDTNGELRYTLENMQSAINSGTGILIAVACQLLDTDDADEKRVMEILTDGT